jgi:hypothetical protein
MTASVDTGKLLELIWASGLAGVSVTVCFSLLIVGITRAGESRRRGRSAVATAYGALSVVAALAFFGGVAFGISVIAS